MDKVITASSSEELGQHFLVGSVGLHGNLDSGFLGTKGRSPPAGRIPTSRKIQLLLRITLVGSGSVRGSSGVLRRWGFPWPARPGRRAWVRAFPQPASARAAIAANIRWRACCFSEVFRRVRDLTEQNEDDGGHDEIALEGTSCGFRPTLAMPPDLQRQRSATARRW